MTDILTELFEDHMDQVISVLGLKSYETTDFSESDADDYYSVSIINPAINLYLHYLSGVLSSLETSNVIVAFASLRGMLETIATLAYFEINDPKNSVYNKFLKSGRIYKKEKTSWIEVSKRNQIKCLDTLTDRNRSWVHLYDVLCSTMHFSNLHFILTLDDFEIDKGVDPRGAKLITKIGMEKMDKDTIKTLLESIEELGQAFKSVLSYHNEHKLKRDSSIQRFNYYPHKDNFFPSDYIAYLKDQQS